ncbi:MAG TPA: hypothetical protein VH184_07370 [Dongiaceae bacterium]|jgi:hypothetical protein|nr:hypothetical protein [Dongiaceae bacterium]
MYWWGNLLVPFALGVLGWLVTHLLANPLLTAYRLREEAPEVIFRTGNTGPSAEHDEWRDARDQLRGLVARIIAANAAALPFLRWALRCFGLDLRKAAEGLTALSNSLEATDGSRALHRAAVERALRLPRTDSDEYLERIEHALGKR